MNNIVQIEKEFLLINFKLWSVGMFKYIIVGFFSLCILPKLALAQDIGGSSTPGGYIKADAAVRKTESRFPKIDDFMKGPQGKLQSLQKYGLRLGLSYQALWLRANESLTGKREGASGYAALSGKWALIGRGSETVGTLAFEIQNRHKLWLDQTPTDLGPAVGFLGTPGITFWDKGGWLDRFYWQQTFQNGKNGFVFGRLDFNDHADFIGHLVPRMAFFNSLSLFNFSQKRPLNGFGAAGRLFFTDNIFTVGAWGDANGSLEDIEWFPGGAEFFYYGEIGWTPSKSDYLKNKFHIGAWHIDEREEANQPSGEGIVAAYNNTFKDVLVSDAELMPFLRLGYSEGQASLFNRMAAGGFIYTHPKYRDQMGLVASWNDPSRSQLREQFVFEAFYKNQLLHNLSITADFQWLRNPSLNPERDNILIFGIGIRFAM